MQRGTEQRRYRFPKIFSKLTLFSHIEKRNFEEAAILIVNNILDKGVIVMWFVSNAEVIRVLRKYKATMWDGHVIIPDDIQIENEVDRDILFCGTTRRGLGFITCGELTLKEDGISPDFVYDFLAAGYGENEIRDIATDEGHPLHAAIDALLGMFEERPYKVLYWMDLWAAVHPQGEK